MVKLYSACACVRVFTVLFICTCVCLMCSIGNVLSSIENPAKVTSLMEARIIVFNIEIPITNGYPVSMCPKVVSIHICKMHLNYMLNLQYCTLYYVGNHALSFCK